MESKLNPAPPLVMHIDLNSAFAMIEQQANPFLRGKPVGMVNRSVPGGTIIAASYEAKRLGIGVGTRVREAKLLAPDIVILETDPPKYVHAHRTFFGIIKNYAPSAQMTSIDEGVIDFNNVQLPAKSDLLDIAQDIKHQLKNQLGEWVTCNIGIAPNRFLAKTAAGLNKPDGLDIIDTSNLSKTYQQLRLVDLPGINQRYKVRLHLAGVLSPLEFLAASQQKLIREVFHGINGYYWYLRLRGWEVDNFTPATKTIGRQYVMHEFTADIKKLEPIIFKLCERLGRRLRSKDYCARGLSIGCWLDSYGRWHNRHKFKGSFYTTQEIFERTLKLFSSRPAEFPVKMLAITTYGLQPAANNQLPLFATSQTKQWQLMKVVDDINNRFGEMVIAPAGLKGTEPYVADKIPFNNIRYLSEQK